MAYNANIPQPSDKLSTSQGQILANFQALSNIGGSNLLPYLLLGPVQGSKPTVSAQMALYTKTSALSAIQALFLEKADGTEIEISTYGTSSSGLSTFGFTILPSGLIVKWGRFKAASATSNVITFPVAGTIPVFTMNPFVAILTTQVTTSSGNPVVNYSQVNTTTLSTYFESGTVTDLTNTYINFVTIGI